MIDQLKKAATVGIAQIGNMITGSNSEITDDIGLNE